MQGYARQRMALHEGQGHAAWFPLDTVPAVRIVATGTTRQDHAAWFTARYGPAVRTEVTGDRYECVGDTE